MRHLDFSLGEMKELPPFKSLITEGAAFQFDQSHIPRIRNEITLLIDRLSKIFLPIRKEQDEAEMKAKQAKINESFSHPYTELRRWSSEGQPPEHLIDNRSQYIIHAPPNNIRESFIEETSNLISTNKYNKMWSYLFGGSGDRRYVADMKTNHPRLHDSLLKASSWYIETITHQYPKLTSHSFSSLLTSPNASAQEFLHVDYNLQTWSRSIDEQPVSAIIAIEAFTLDIVSSENRETLQTVTVDPGNMIVFTNKCIHRGGANPNNEYARRIFMYCAHDPSDIGVQKVTKYEWDTSSKKYALVPQNEESTSNSLSRRIRK